jgi:hypothetical protein
VGLVERHPAVAAGGAEADVASFEDRDLEAGVALLEKVGGDQARIAAAEADDVGLALALEGRLQMLAVNGLEPVALVRGELRSLTFRTALIVSSMVKTT